MSKTEEKENHSTLVRLADGRWTYPESDMLKHGQHCPEMEGCWGYVNAFLLNAEDVEIFEKMYEEIEENGNVRVQSIQTED